MDSSWAFFFLCSAVGLILLVLPGWLVMLSFGRRDISGLLVSPAISLALYCLLSILLCSVGIFASWQTIVIPVFLLAFICFTASFAHSHTLCSITKNDVILLIMATLIGLAITLYLFVLPLDGPSSFNQDADNTFHLSLIKSFSMSGVRCPIHSSLYYDLNQLSPNEVVYNSGMSFYPAAWHMFASLLVNMLDVPIAMAANASLYIFIAVVWPFSALSLIVLLLPNTRRAWLSGLIASFAFTAFPWALLTFGPLYPNIIGLIFVPVTIAQFINLTSFRDFEFHSTLSNLTIFILTVISLCLGHPNAFFSTAIICFPYATIQSYNITKYIIKSSNPNGRAALISAGLIFISALLWVFARNIPALQSVTEFNWPSSESFSQELINLITLSFNTPVSQLVLAAILVVGATYILKRSRNLRWLLVSYLLSLVICFVGATTDGEIKGILAGYWYSDPYRLAATAAIAAIPIAAVGVYALSAQLSAAVYSYMAPSFSKQGGKAAVLFSAVILLTVLFYPSFSIRGIAEIDTSSGYIRRTLSNLYDSARANLFDPEEIRFTQKVSDIVDPNYVIFNNADDGSTFSYPLFGLNLFYRRSDSAGDTEAARLLRKNIDEAASSSSIQQILLNANIRYVLILDEGGEVTQDRCFYGYYDPSEWTGLNRLTEDTPGFRLLLHEGDMSLYEVEGLYS